MHLHSLESFPSPTSFHSFVVQFSFYLSLLLIMKCLFIFVVLFPLRYLQRVYLIDDCRISSCLRTTRQFRLQMICILLCLSIFFVEVPSLVCNLLNDVYQLFPISNKMTYHILQFLPSSTVSYALQLLKHYRNKIKLF